MPAPRPTSSTGERSYTSTSQPTRRRNAALNRPDIEPPMMIARRFLCCRPGMAPSAQKSIEQRQADQRRQCDDGIGDAAVQPIGRAMEIFGADGGGEKKWNRQKQSQRQQFRCEQALPEI